MTSIAFIGLGRMGAPMARNLLRAGNKVTVYDLDTANAISLAGDGAKVAATPAEAAATSDMVFTMLPNDAAVEGLYYGADGLLAQLKGGSQLLVDCSTIGPDTTRKLAAAAHDHGLTMLDAPVSGGPQGAADGTLSFMVGGDATAFERIRPLLEAMGRMIVHVGDNGAGQVAKLCNNMTAAVIMLATSEALALGIGQGLDPARLSEIMANSSGGSFILNRWNPWPGVMPGAPASNDYVAGFQLGLMLKDLGLAVDNARQSGASVPMGALAQSLFAMQANQAPDAPRADFSSVQKLFLRQG